MNDIVFIKLISGEELIAERIGDGKNFGIVNALQVFAHPTPDGQMGVQVLPFAFAVVEDEVMNISSDNIIIGPVPAKDDFIRMHRERFSKIQMVTNPGILHS